jgi:Uma2 family endonuclease
LNHEATIEDLLAVPESQRAELINGDLIYHPQPFPRHGQAQRSLGSILGPFGRKSGEEGPGGWWILTEAGVRYATNAACRHDLAGWKRERLPMLLDDEYVSVTPDWVCEILSPSNRSNDLVRKKRYSIERMSRTTGRSIRRKSLHKLIAGQKPAT